MLNDFEANKVLQIGNQDFGERNVQVPGHKACEDVCMLALSTSL